MIYYFVLWNERFCKISNIKLYSKIKRVKFWYKGYKYMILCILKCNIFIVKEDK